jgi:class 3 adenylate cyclase/ABC-type uncharacterized transport system substrate-binding protein
MAVPWEWKRIDCFGSLRERDCFLSWMRGQIASGISEEIEPPPNQPREPGDQWFRHIPTGSLWRVGPIDSYYGPGFWLVQEKSRVHRRLAAILAADVVGYSALMQRAEEATYAEFERLKRELIEPSLSRHEGRLIKTTGDGALAEFASPLAAVGCAVEIQDHLASGSSPLSLRIGLNLGDVIVGKDGELYGDGINIAVRLEGIADPGGILISEKVYSEVEGKLDVDFEDRGEQRLKNISKPVHAYAVRAMRRREFVSLFVSTAVAWPLATRAQQPKMPRIGWVVTGSPTSHRFSLAAFQDGLKALGYVEGRNISVEYRWAQGNLSRLPELANDLVQLKVDAILAGEMPVVEAVKLATSTIPIVAAGVGDLAFLRSLVGSLGRPVGNLTGFVATAPETAAKRFEIMREIKPQARRAAVLANLDSTTTPRLELGFAKESAAAGDFAITLYDPRGVEKLTSVLTQIPQSNPDILVVLNDPVLFTYRKLIVEAANKQQLPGVYGFREFVEDGGLISYGTAIPDTYRRAAGYVDRILKGEKPADLPVQLPTKFEMVVNLKTAEALRLTIPQTLLATADDVIE